MSNVEIEENRRHAALVQRKIERLERSLNDLRERRPPAGVSFAGAIRETEAILKEERELLRLLLENPV